MMELPNAGARVQRARFLFCMPFTNCHPRRYRLLFAQYPCRFQRVPLNVSVEQFIFMWITFKGQGRTNFATFTILRKNAKEPACYLDVGHLPCHTILDRHLTFTSFACQFRSSYPISHFAMQASKHLVSTPVWPITLCKETPSIVALLRNSASLAPTITS